MSANNAPWGTAEDGPAAILNGLRRHWPHYTTATLAITATWDFEAAVHFPDVPSEEDPEVIECIAQDRTDTWTATATGTLTWTRQDPAEETYGTTPASGELYGYLDQVGDYLTGLDATEIAAVLTHAFALAASATTLTGDISQTVHTGDACAITATTTTGTVTLSGHPGTLGLIEDALGQWWKFHTPTGGLAPVEIDTATGPGLPSALPTQPTGTATLLAGPPAGTAVTFTFTDTLTVPDLGSWHGTADLSYTLTLSTT